jgi:tetratricopeptide (TPR) repeat protein
LFWVLGPWLGSAASTLREEIEKEHLAARQEWRTNRTNLVVVLRYGETAFAWADTVASNDQRAAVADEAVTALRSAVRDHPGSAAAHYFLAMNLGQLARTRTFGALRLVDEMVEHFNLARGLDPALEHSGPDRNLGRLHHQAPGWPFSVGSAAKARRHLEAAVERAPEFPANHLALLDFLVAHKETAGATKQLETLDGIWEAAKQRWKEREWEDDWNEWNEQRDGIRRQLERLGGKPAVSLVPPKRQK